jgi:hypothetical protein
MGIIGRCDFQNSREREPPGPTSNILIFYSEVNLGPLLLNKKKFDAKSLQSGVRTTWQDFAGIVSDTSALSGVQLQVIWHL